MASTNLSGSSAEDDDIFSSQFAALLKPIRELTKQGCWELNIAEKLDEYVHYVQDLPIEVNVNGEQMKLDFAKAAMVVQNSVQIYSKKVENLWVLLQEVIEFLSSHGDTNENNEEGQNAGGLKGKRGSRRRQHKGDVDLLEMIPLKFRKCSSKIKKKSATKDLKMIHVLPYEILQLEEIIGSSTSLKIKLYTLSCEHLGYPSDLRSNFPFDPSTLFLKINHTSTKVIQPGGLESIQVEHTTSKQAQVEPAVLTTHEEEFDDPIPNLDDWQNDKYNSSDNLLPLQEEDPVLDEHNNFNTSKEELVERMQLRQRPLAPIPASNEELNDPWKGMEPYSEDESIKKPCGPPIRCKIPAVLQKKKRKEIGKEPRSDEYIEGIDEYLGKGHILVKKPSLRYSQPDNEFWEDYVHFTKTTGTVIKNQRKLQPERNIAGGIDDSDQEDPMNDENQDNDCIHRDSALDRSGGLDASGDDFHDDLPETPIEAGFSSPNKDLDESKQFFELVQQFMAEYTASAKQFVTSTESTRRVQAWHEMIQPRLREAESRRDFDIHQYGSRVLDVFGSDAPVGSHCTFSQVVQQQPKNEVARFFLATLQLANAYNVEIELQEALSLDGLELKLLSRERHHEHMDDFMS